MRQACAHMALVNDAKPKGQNTMRPKLTENAKISRHLTGQARFVVAPAPSLLSRIAYAIRAAFRSL